MGVDGQLVCPPIFKIGMSCFGSGGFDSHLPSPSLCLEGVWMDTACFRAIPKTDALLRTQPFQTLAERYSYASVSNAAKDVLHSIREGLKNGSIAEVPDNNEIFQVVEKKLMALRDMGLRRVVNATGIILHTNFGRAPLGDKTVQRIVETAAGYCDLEFDAETGERFDRCAYLERKLIALTGAEAACVVNNNASAVFLMLHALAKGKGVAVSRGELVEIGGGFRIHEILAESGAVLCEVGATNKTRIDDYANVDADRNIGALLKVHRSNFSMHGFTEEVSLTELTELAHRNDLLMLYDAGALSLAEIQDGALQDAVARHVIKSGADAVCFSGDKLLGSVQSGILVGKKNAIEAIRKDPLYRVLRPDKLTIVALETALDAAFDQGLSPNAVPIIEMLRVSEEVLQERAMLLVKKIEAQNVPLICNVVSVTDEIGGGAMPDTALKGFAVAIRSDAFSAQEIAERFRMHTTPVIGCIRNNTFLLSVRTLQNGDDDRILNAAVDSFGGHA